MKNVINDRRREISFLLGFCKILGGQRSAARSLRVNDRTFRRWMNGECDIPWCAFELLRRISIEYKSKSMSLGICPINESIIREALDQGSIPVIALARSSHAEIAFVCETRLRDHLRGIALVSNEMNNLDNMRSFSSLDGTASPYSKIRELSEKIRRNISKSLFDESVNLFNFIAMEDFFGRM